MAAQRLTDLGAWPGDDVEHPGRQPGLRGELGQTQRGQRRVRGRLEHHGVARRDGRPELPGRDDQGIVPGHDRRHDAHRLPGDQPELVRGTRRDLVVALVDGLAVPGQAIGRLRDIDPDRVADRVPGIEALQQAQVLQVVAHEIRPADHHALPLDRGEVAPAAVLERGARGADRPVDVFGIACRDLGHHRAVARRDVGAAPAGRGGHERAVDERVRRRHDRPGTGQPVIEPEATRVGRGARGHAA